uniref:Uncharacterized protein n=1 Tax=Taeniopygia guttata TaxID=59729 RepID=A0A674HEL3_TAEGU
DRGHRGWHREGSWGLSSALSRQSGTPSQRRWPGAHGGSQPLSSLPSGQSLSPSQRHPRGTQPPLAQRRDRGGQGAAGAVTVAGTVTVAVSAISPGWGSPAGRYRGVPGGPGAAVPPHPSPGQLASSAPSGQWR